ncbi:unnamed protein product [Prunus armeniaca]
MSVVVIFRPISSSSVTRRWRCVFGTTNSHCLLNDCVEGERERRGEGERTEGVLRMHEERELGI